ncbi:MAG: hypothetical protein ABI036_08670 [Fibrobacteria bacterium]
MFESKDTPPSARAEHFQYVGDADFSTSGSYSVALRVNRDGMAYVAFTDASDSGRAVVMRFSPASRRWEKLDGSGLSVGAVYVFDLALGPDGTPYLAFIDEGDSMRATVKHWEPDSQRWELVGRKEATPIGVSQLALEMDPAGEPVLAYKDERHFGRATVLRYGKAGNEWNTVGDSGFTDAEVNFLSLAIDPAGTPYVGYYDEERTGRGSAMRYVGQAEGWKPAGELGFSPGKANNVVMAIGADGTPYFGYADGFDFTFKATVRRLTAGTWAPVGAESFSSGQVLSLAMAISPKGAPYVAFCNYDQGGALNMLRWDDAAGAWRDVDASNLAVIFGRSVALAFGPSGEPWIAFVKKESGRLSVMRLSE